MLRQYTAWGGHDGTGQPHRQTRTALGKGTNAEA